MTTFEYAVSDYKIACEIGENGILITGVRGNGSNLTIPEEIVYRDKQYPVLQIGKKAALSCRTLREVFVPDGVISIGDWAFAQCPQLTSIRIPKGVSLGVGVFEDCPGLLQICVEGEEDFSLDLSVLLATCVWRLPSEDLLRDVGGVGDIGGIGLLARGRIHIMLDQANRHRWHSRKCPCFRGCKSPCLTAELSKYGKTVQYIQSTA